MIFRRLALYFEKLEKTASRNEKIEILARLLSEAGPDEIDKIVYLTQARLAPLFEPIEFNLAEKLMVKVLTRAFEKEKTEVRKLFRQGGDLGLAAQTLKQMTNREAAARQNVRALSVEEVYTILLKVAQEEGTGSQKRKLEEMAGLIKDLDGLSTKYAVRIPLGAMRLGFSEVTILDGLSFMKRGDKSLRKELERAYNVSADIGKIAKIFKKQGLAGIKKIEASAGTPIRAAQAERLETAEKIAEKLGRFAVEKKMDGFRVQIHIKNKAKVKDKEIIRLFSRNLEDTTAMFPEIVAGAKKLPVKSAILDGEAIAFDPKTDKFLAFQETMQRKRKYKILELAKTTPLKAFIFDCLYLNGKTLLDQPFEKRRQALEKIVFGAPKESIVLAEQKIVERAEDLRKLFEKAIEENLEGVMVKKLDSVYQAGGRNFNWVKFKKTTEGTGLADTLDCLVLGYYPGRGKRAGFGIGGFLAGVYNPKTEKYYTVSKIGTGLTDELFREMKKRCDKATAAQQPEGYEVPKELRPGYWCKPEIVVEIKADEITRSPLHTAGKTAKQSGLALRFPRLVKFRDDKSPTQVTSVKELTRLYKIQGGFGLNG